METWGVVIDVRRTSFDVLIPEMATVKRIFFDKVEDKLMPVERTSGDVFRAYRDREDGNQVQQIFPCQKKGHSH